MLYQLSLWEKVFAPLVTGSKNLPNCIDQSGKRYKIIYKVLGLLCQSPDTVLASLPISEAYWSKTTHFYPSM